MAAQRSSAGLSANDGTRTRLTMRSLFASAAERDRVADFGAVELGKQTLERLAEYLATMEQ